MKIMLFDDHLLFAKSLELLIGEFVTNFYHFNETKEILKEIRNYQPDIVFMDIHLGEVNGLEVGEQLLVTFPDIKLVFLSGYDLPEYHHRAIQIGAKGFINKNIDPNHFIKKIEDIQAGATIFPAQASMLIEPLSEREKQVLQLLSDGFSQQEVADELMISRRTVNNHLQTIYMKLDVNSSVSAIVKGIEMGMIQLKNNR